MTYLVSLYFLHSSLFWVILAIVYTQTSVDIQMQICSWLLIFQIAMATAAPSNRSSSDGLPRQFVESMHTLFNILDEEQTGMISLQDIQSRWREGKAEGLPSGVLSALSKVTPANGYINFDRFVAGLKIALLRRRQDSPKAAQIKYDRRPQREPDLIADHIADNKSYATVHPNNALSKNSSSSSSLSDLHTAIDAAMPRDTNAQSSWSKLGATQNSNPTYIATVNAPETKQVWSSPTTSAKYHR